MKYKKYNPKNVDIESTYEDDDEINDCFSFDESTPPGNQIASFSFGSSDNNPIPEKTITKRQETKIQSTITPATAKEITKEKIHDNRNNKFANGITPPINNESLNIRRTYLLRASTIKKINQLVAYDDDINVYVSTIVDKAINFYYDSVINQTTNKK